MENTLKNKAKFFALYWGQNIMREEMDSQTYYCKPSNESEFALNYLELTPLSMISDEDLGNAARLYEKSATNVYIHDNQLTFDYLSGDEVNNVAIELNSGSCLDYLRANGYAMEWMGLSVEKLIEFGWVKWKRV